MAFSSFKWPFRRRSSSGDGPSKPAAPSAAEEEELGVTPQLLDFLQTLSPDAFKSSALQLNQGGSAEAAGGELSDWQQWHAVLVLARAKELAKIRYNLCPRHMKDEQFWTLYFLLARSYILPYKLHAIQKEKRTGAPICPQGLVRRPFGSLYSSTGRTMSFLSVTIFDRDL